MTMTLGNRLLQHLRNVVSPADVSAMSDAQLLDSFLTERREAAFAAIVQRHGPMVWGVCRRTLRDVHDAEDAFQATFLVLVRKAPQIAPRDLVGHWLYGVAYRTCCKLRCSNARRLARERAYLPADKGSATSTDLKEVIDQELHRLPVKYRQVIVACDLECKSRQLAARQLGLREGTLSSRLARGRDMLRRGLLRRGVDVTATALTTFLAGHACAAPPATASLAIQASQLVSSRVARLAGRVIAAMAICRLRILVLAAVAVVALAGVLYSLRDIFGDRAALNLGGEVPAVKDRPRQGEKLLPRNLQTWRCIEVADQAGNLTFAPDGSFFLATIGNQVHLWDGRDASPIGNYRCGIDWAEKIVLADDSSRAAGFYGKQLVIWDVRMGAVVSKLTHTDSFYAACFSPDGKYLLTSNGTFVNPQVNYVNSAVHLWEVASGKLLRTFTGLHRPAKAVAFGPTGHILASTTALLTRWDDDSGKVISTSRFRNTSYEYPVFSRDGAECLVPMAKSFASWRTQDGEQVAQFADLPVPVVRWLHTSRNRRFIISACASDNIGRVWDVKHPGQGCELLGHTDYLTGAAIAPDGRLAVTCSRDKTIRVYQVSEE